MDLPPDLQPSQLISSEQNLYISPPNVRHRLSIGGLVIHCTAATYPIPLRHDRPIVQDLPSVRNPHEKSPCQLRTPRCLRSSRSNPQPTTHRPCHPGFLPSLQTSHLLVRLPICSEGRVMGGLATGRNVRWRSQSPRLRSRVFKSRYHLHTLP